MFLSLKLNSFNHIAVLHLLHMMSMKNFIGKTVYKNNFLLFGPPQVSSCLSGNILNYSRVFANPDIYHCSWFYPPPTFNPSVEYIRAHILYGIR